MNDSLPFVIANLKANKTWQEIEVWLDEVAKTAANFPGTVVVCPSYPFLKVAALEIKSASWRIKLASQDVSKFEQGAYTGEVAASQIKDICSYSIIGHSERRRNFGEDDQTLTVKVQNAIAAKLMPIFCVQDENTPIPHGVEIVAYEPPSAIGSGNPDTPENAHIVSQKIKEKGDHTVIYGGSVDSKNAASFLKKGIIDGLLVGKSCLDPQEFTSILASIK